jgi:hypothetical protein
MKIEVIKTPKGRAIKTGEICCVDAKKKHWMCMIKGLDEKYGLSRDFLGRAMYDTKGKAGGYAVDNLKEGQIIEEGDESGKNGYREYARITKIGDSSLEFEYMRADDVVEHFKSLKKTA